jgi:hypothetical protein
MMMTTKQTADLKPSHGVASTPPARSRILLGAALALATMLSVPTAKAATPPDLIKQPGALNLGGTSFMDGFGRLDTGFTFLQYAHTSNLTNITDIHGNTISNKIVNEPHIKVEATLEQLSFTTPWHPFGDAVAFSAALPVSNVKESSSPPPGSRLSGNGLGIGDMTWGPIYQSAPFMLDGRPVFSYRAQLQIISPTGSFSSAHNLNNSSGFWTINPYISFTVKPTANWEISTRTHYVYNFAGESFSNPPVIPGLVYRDGQAGQAGFVNFASSYKLTDEFSLGVNGFWLKAFTDDKVNGIEIPNSKQQFLYFGPGGRYEFSNKTLMNVNLYFPLIANNVPSGFQFNLQFVYKFDTLTSI